MNTNSRNSRPPRSPQPPHTPHTRRGTVLQITVALLAAGAVVWGGIASVTPSSTTSTTATNAKRAKFRSPSTPIEIEAALGELGLTPKTLCAAGFNAQQTTAFTTAAAAYARTNIATYRAAMDAAGSARSNVNRLTRLIQGGAASAEDITALATAQTALASASADRQAFLNSAMAEGSAAVNGGGGEVITLLNTVRTNSRAWDIPASYLGDNRSEAAWVQLRDALANDRIATSLQQDPNPTCHQLLLTAQATTNAAAAFSNLSNLSDIQTAWIAALNP